jgi:hypothetical protein
MAKPESQSSEHPTCPACGRSVRSGIRCVATYCPYELTVKNGNVVVARPVRQRIK